MDVNNLGVLGIAAANTATYSHIPHSVAGRISGHFGQMNNLIQGVAIAVGYVTLLATVGSCHVWLELTALEREDLLGVPIALDTLFGCVCSVTQCFKRLKGERTQLNCHLPLYPYSSQRWYIIHCHNTMVRLCSRYGNGLGKQKWTCRSQHLLSVLILPDVTNVTHYFTYLL